MTIPLSPPISRRFSLPSALPLTLLLLSGLFGCQGEIDPADESSTESADFKLTVGAGVLTLNQDEAVRVNVVVSTTSAASLYTLVYESSNSQVASVSADGVVKGLSSGSAVVTVTATVLDSGKKASASVTVNVQAVPVWTPCAVEGGTCSFTGTQLVRYGANGTYVYQTATGSIPCTNAVFGDPLVGTQKSCDYAPASTTVPTADAGTPPSAPRDPLKQPFTSDSIWNMPIGTGAVYAPANLPTTFNSGNTTNDTWAPFPAIDLERIVLKPTAPLMTINYSSAGWSGANRCSATASSGGGLPVSVPMPSGYVVPNSNRNEGAAFLLADGHTIVQTQPLARCTAGGPATSIVKFANVDLYGAGITGAHGGSGLSVLGGTIRLGELRPGQQGPKHALKVDVYAKHALYRCTVRADCFRWPAVAADSYAVGTYGTEGNNTNTAMKMGSLLAIPPSINIANLGLKTEPARQLAWTLQNYGAYIVDDAAGPGFYFAAEDGADGSKPAEFQNDYGFAMAQRLNDNSDWVHDVQALVRALSVVDNNGPTSIGGGGTPRQPLAAPLH